MKYISIILLLAMGLITSCTSDNIEVFLLDYYDTELEGTYIGFNSNTMKPAGVTFFLSGEEGYFDTHNTTTGEFISYAIVDPKMVVQGNVPIQLAILHNATDTNIAISYTHLEPGIIMLSVQPMNGGAAYMFYLVHESLDDLADLT